MSTPSTRRLAAIMFTDMVGYSALTQRDETLALDLLDEHNKLIRASLAVHQGREIKTVGDAFLVEFDSALQAVRCAMRIQQDIAMRNAVCETTNAEPINIRVGIHLGDVVYRENDVFGDGVNIAARVQSSADAGEIRISEDVARQVTNKIEQKLVDLGVLALKNISQPIQLYAVEGFGAPQAVSVAAPQRSAAVPPPTSKARPLPVKMLVTAGIGLAITATLLFVQPWKGTTTPQPAASSSNASPEIKQLVAQAEDLIRDPMTATRENYILAEELMQRVLKTENNNADYWVLAARISQMLIRQSYDRSTQRAQVLNEQVEKAARLRPDLFAVKELIARQQWINNNIAEATRLANEILAKDPVNREALSIRANIARQEGRDADVAEALAALQKLPGGDPLSLLFESLQLGRAARLYEAEKVLDGLLAISPTRIAYFAKVEFVNNYLADPSSAAAYVAQIPERLLREEGLGPMAAHAFILSGKGDDALALLNKIPRDFLSEFAITDPKGLFTGSAHEVAGRPAAAAAEWRGALALVEKRLATDANNLSSLQSKAVLQAMLGQKSEALDTLRLRIELGAKNRPPPLFSRTHILVRCGKEADAIAQIRAEWAKTSFLFRSLLVRDLAHMPIYAKMRQDKYIAGLIAEHYAFIKAARAAPTAPATKL